MLKQTITFTDYNEQERTIEEYFHLNEAELIDMQAHSEGGIQADLEKAIKSNDIGQILDFIKFLVLKSYGKKSADGIHFDKSEELTRSFVNSAYYSDFLLGLLEDNGDKGIAFISGVMPKKLIDRALAQAKGNPNDPESQALIQQFAPSAREQFAQAKQPAPQPTPAPIPTYSGAFEPAAAPQETAEQRDEREYLEWKANRAQAVPTQVRVREEEPLQGFQQ